MRIDLERSSGRNHINNAAEMRNSPEAAVSAPVVAEYDAPSLPRGDRAETSSRKSFEPCDSMEFESKEDAFEFYKEYAASLGFSAIIKASRRSRISGKFIDAKFVCTRYGRKPGNCLSENSELTDSTGSIPVKKKRGRIDQSWSKTDCKATMHVKRRQDGRWIISSFMREHNHDLALDQPAVTCQHNIHAPHPVRVKKKRMLVPMSRQPGGSQEVEHHKSIRSRSSALRLGLQEGDVQDMLEYFSCMQDENPYFFHALGFDGEQHLKNIFWVEAKGRVDYLNFGDVVLLDTTHRKNEFKLPFVPFVGMNNHFHSILLGCALVDDKSKATYTWLMQAWLRSMHGHAPKVILTNHDAALKEAIAEVLPGSHHCFCLWHMLSAVQEKLGYVIKQHENFMDKFCKCVLKSGTEAIFEKRWWKLVGRFELRTDEWIQSLYNDRLRWVPVFMKDIFFAGLSSTQCLESVASHLDKRLLHKSSLKEFLHEYKRMLQEKYEDEAKADFDSWHKLPVLKSPSPYGKQMSSVYTNTVFKRFQVEVLGVVACHPKIESKDGAATTFKVHDFEENQVYQVTWNEETSDISCVCLMFEYNGFLCRHVMIVLQISGVSTIPTKYILKRWTKEAKNGETSKHVDFIESSNQRYNDFCQRAYRLVDEGSSSLERYKVAFAAMEEAFRMCEGINNSVLNTLDNNSHSNEGRHDFEVNPSKFSSKTDKKEILTEKDMGQLHTGPQYTNSFANPT